jgi:hypothetical protein
VPGRKDKEIPAGQPGAGYPCMGQPRRGTDAGGHGVFESSPCYAWNNTFNGQPLRMEVSRRTDVSENERAQIKEGRDFFNEKPKPEYYKPYTWPPPRRHCWTGQQWHPATKFFSR